MSRDRIEMTYNSGLQLDFNQGHCNYTADVLKPTGHHDSPGSGSQIYSVWLDVRIPRSTAGKLGHLLLFFLLEKAVKKTALPTHRNKQPLMFSGPHSSERNTFFLLVIHRGAKPQF